MARQTLVAAKIKNVYVLSSEVDYLQLRILEVEAQLEKFRLALLETKAELAFVRHRVQEDILYTHKYAIDGFARSLLGVKDSLEIALLAETAAHKADKSDIALVYSMLVAAFEAFGLSEINSQAGQPFDPSRHRLVASIADGREENIVVEVRQKGYQIADRLLRPALVTTSVLTKCR